MEWGVNTSYIGKASQWNSLQLAYTNTDKIKLTEFKATLSYVLTCLQKKFLWNDSSWSLRPSFFVQSARLRHLSKGAGDSASWISALEPGSRSFNQMLWSQAHCAHFQSHSFSFEIIGFIQAWRPKPSIGETEAEGLPQAGGQLGLQNVF